MKSFGRFGRGPKGPSKSKFARLLIDAFRRAGEKAKIHYDAPEFCLRTEGETHRIFWLTNAYKEYCAAGPEQRQALLRNFVRSWLVPEHAVPENFEDVHPDLLPSVRARGYFEVTLLQLKADGHASEDRAYRTFAEHLAVGLAYDLPGAILQIGQHNLDEWKVSFDDALKAACDNMRGVTKEPMKQAVPGVWVSPYYDNHDASRLVLTDWVRQCEVRGDYVALVPNRDMLLVTGSEDEAGLVAVAKTAEAALEKPRFISGVGLRLAGDTWEEHLPPPGHPAHVAFRRLRTNSLARDYASQGDALKVLCEKKGEDVFVAPCSLLRRKDTDELISHTVWAEGVPALLPEADVVFFFRMKEDGKDGEIVANAPWALVRQVAGDLMKPQGLYPERYRVAAFPSAEQVAALRASPIL